MQPEEVVMLYLAEEGSVRERGRKKDRGKRSGLRNRLFGAVGVGAHFTWPSIGSEVDGCGFLSLCNVRDRSGAD